MYHDYDHPRRCITSENEEHIRTNSQVPHETRMTSSAARHPCRAAAAAQRFVARYDIQDGLECTRTCSDHHSFVMIAMRTSFYKQNDNLAMKRSCGRSRNPVLPARAYSGEIGSLKSRLAIVTFNLVCIQKSIVSLLLGAGWRPWPLPSKCE